MARKETAEHRRLAAARTDRSDWRMWGPYLADRAWGTVREDYSANGEPWQCFTHDQARSRAYRWNEDGIGGVSNLHQNLCLATAFWNERDPILKVRLFGVTGPEGNHGEDVKELYFYLDATPTHSYLKMLYKYPQVAYPYEDLVIQNRQRGYCDPEYELTEALNKALAERLLFDITIGNPVSMPNHCSAVSASLLTRTPMRLDLRMPRSESPATASSAPIRHASW